jgi:hypothetical protein
MTNLCPNEAEAVGYTVPFTGSDDLGKQGGRSEPHGSDKRESHRLGYSSAGR